RLPAAPAPAAAPEATTVCPECRRPQPARLLEAHLRLAHRVFSYRGVRRPYTETLAALLDALVAAEPDAAAWATLQAIAGEEHKERAAFFLTTALGQRLSRVEPERRAAAVNALAKLLVAQDVGVVLSALLASDAESAARHLA